MVNKCCATSGDENWRTYVNRREPVSTEILYLMIQFINLSIHVLKLVDAEFAWAIFVDLDFTEIHPIILWSLLPVHHFDSGNTAAILYCTLHMGCLVYGRWCVLDLQSVMSAGYTKIASRMSTVMTPSIGGRKNMSANHYVYCRFSEPNLSHSLTSLTHRIWWLVCIFAIPTSAQCWL